jgi:hypothetical protein
MHEVVARRIVGADTKGVLWGGVFFLGGVLLLVWRGCVVGEGVCFWV